MKSLFLALCAVSAVWAQAGWRSVLYPVEWTPPGAQQFETDRMIQDFSYAGYRRGEASIPAVAGPIFDVIQFGADPNGAGDSTTAIQNAINAAAAAGGGVVHLPPGVFKVSPQGANNHALRIASNHVVLRGAGPTKTFVFNDAHEMRGKSIIRVDGSGSAWAALPAGVSAVSIRADLPGPTSTIPVASAAGFAVGDWIVLRADATDAFVAEHNMTDLWAGQGGALGGVMFLRQITAIDGPGATLTIDVPIRYYLKTRDNARVHRAVPHVDEVGLEDLSIGNREHPASANRTGWGEEDYATAGNGAFDVHGSFAIAFRRARNSWISNVTTYRPSTNRLNTHLLSNGVLLENCRGVTVRNCDFQRPLYGGGGGNGYMYRVQASNECLIRDSAARYNRHGFVFSHMACSGNVIHGGIAQVTRTQAAGAGTTGGEGCDHHMHLSQSNLIDGVQLDQDFFTAHYRGTSGTPPQHGQGAVHSIFWNLVGLEYHGTKNYIVRSEQARHGYMIGTRGRATGMTTTSGANAARTGPVDLAEGAGLGDTLQPLSLYHDQLRRRLGAAPVPPVPTALTVRSGVRESVLAWNSASSATAYRVRRALVSGGPYTLLATLPATTYTDGNLSTSTTYYYVVSALNDAGESGPSLEVSATPAPAFQQDTGGDRVVVMEAEHFDAHVAQGGHAWVANATAGFAGDGAIQAAPNSGATRDAGFTSSSPRVDFRVNFVATGTHQVWVRGIGASGNDDSVHVGLNGAGVASSDRITGFGTNWTWRNTTSDGPPATIDIPSAGVHTVNLWMREDGVVVDRILLTPETSFSPSGTGPNESGRVGIIPAAIPAATVVNLATRAMVGGVGGTPIMGFVVGGAGAKRVLVRAVGPGLAPFGISGIAVSASVAVIAGGQTLVSNDAWLSGDAVTFREVGAFALPQASRDAAVVVTLPAGAYSTPVETSSGSGIALLEIYDAQPGSSTVFMNASARAYVGTGDAVLIPGFTIAGPGTVRLLLRAVGPTLAGFGVDGALSDPQLALYNAATAVAENGDWGAGANAAEIASAAMQVGAFALPAGSRDSALLLSLAAGAYTATVSGMGGATGTVLVEIYRVP